MFDQDQKTNVEKIEASIKLRLGVHIIPLLYPGEKKQIYIKSSPNSLGEARLETL